MEKLITKRNIFVVSCFGILLILLAYLFLFNSNKELCFCLSTHTAKSRKDLNDLKKILPNMLSSANNLKKALFKD